MPDFISRGDPQACACGKEGLHRLGKAFCFSHGLPFHSPAGGFKPGNRPQNRRQKKARYQVAGESNEELEETERILLQCSKVVLFLFVMVVIPQRHKRNLA